MNAPAASVPLGELLKRSSQTLLIDPVAEYQEITVRLWGKGVVRRGYVSGSELAGSRRFVARTGQFILSRIDARHGANGIVPAGLDGALVTNDFPLFNFDRSRLEPSYFQWLTRTRGFIDVCRRASEGTTNRVRLSEDRFLSLSIPLPPLQEQKRVAERIDVVSTRLIEANTLRKQQQDEAKRLLLSVFHRISADAPRAKMRDVAPLVRRPVEFSYEALYPELGVRSFFKGTFAKPALSAVELGTKRVFWIEPGDLVFSNVFAWEGAIAIAKPKDAHRIGSHRFITCVPVAGIAEGRYLLQYFQTEEGFSRIREASPGGAGRNRTLGLGFLANIDVPMPSIKKQQWFAELHRKVEDLLHAQDGIDPLYEALIPAVLERSFKAA